MQGLQRLLCWGISSLSKLSPASRVVLLVWCDWHKVLSWDAVPEKGMRCWVGSAGIAKLLCTRQVSLLFPKLSPASKTSLCACRAGHGCCFGRAGAAQVLCVWQIKLAAPLDITLPALALPHQAFVHTPAHLRVRLLGRAQGPGLRVQELHSCCAWGIS